jgi:Fe-S oxidoreductase
MKSEFLSTYWQRYGTPFSARALGRIDRLAVWGSRFAPVSSAIAQSDIARVVNELVLGIDRRRTLPSFAHQTLRDRMAAQKSEISGSQRGIALFADTFTNHFHPGIGLAAADVARRLGHHVSLAPNVCCGRPLISQGLLAEARERGRQNVERLQSLVRDGRPIVFLEPSCLSAIKEDLPDLLTGDDRQKARIIASRAVLFERWLEGELREGRTSASFKSGPARIVVHGHCHQKAMAELAPAKALLSRIPGATIVDPDAGCCGMAGSFGYMKSHFDVSRTIGERRLLPTARALAANDVLVASGTSCRQQIADFTGVRAYHAAELVQNLLTP